MCANSTGHPNCDPGCGHTTLSDRYATKGCQHTPQVKLQKGHMNAKQAHQCWHPRTCPRCLHHAHPHCTRPQSRENTGYSRLVIWCCSVFSKFPPAHRTVPTVCTRGANCNLPVTHPFPPHKLAANALDRRLSQGPTRTWRIPAQDRQQVSVRAGWDGDGGGGGAAAAAARFEATSQLNKPSQDAHSPVRKGPRVVVR